MVAQPVQVYTENVSLRIGFSRWWYLIVGSADFTASNDWIKLAHLGAEYHFERSSIQQISFCRSGFLNGFRRGIQIQHTIKFYPPYFVVLSSSFDKFAANLEGFEYNIPF